ncbi:hypothetical protein Tco_1130144 [Tanacetum coccineum]
MSKLRAMNKKFGLHLANIMKSKDDSGVSGDGGGDEGSAATAAMSALVAADIGVWGQADILALRCLIDGTGVGADSSVLNASVSSAEGTRSSTGTTEESARAGCSSSSSSSSEASCSSLSSSSASSSSASSSSSLDDSSSSSSPPLARHHHRLLHWQDSRQDPLRGPPLDPPPD